MKMEENVAYGTTAARMQADAATQTSPEYEEIPRYFELEH